MSTTHDDLPHPVPPLAFLRWKENYFFIVIDPDHEVFGVAHFSFEPAYDRARFSCNMAVAGTTYRYSNVTRFPADFAYAAELGDDHLHLELPRHGTGFGLCFRGEELELDLRFTPRFPTFDYVTCEFAAPELVSFKELLTLGLNLPYRHHQQAMAVSGAVTVAGGPTTEVGGYGYRDHSWCMRSDNLVNRHTWCGFSFQDIAFGAKVLETVVRPGVWAKEGYVATSEGLTALRSIDVSSIDDEQGRPISVVHELVDVFGRPYTIHSDLGGRLAHVPLVSETPGTEHRYVITESFCRCRLLETGAVGYALVETGRHESTADLGARAAPG